MRKKQELYIFLALALLTIIVRLPSLVEPLDNDGGVIAYHARQIIRGEPLYSSHHPDHQLPAVFYTAALTFKLLGDNQISLKIIIIPFILACAWTLFLMGRSIHGELVGWLGAVFYILVSAQALLTGTMVKIEPFANFPLTAGVMAAIILFRKNAPARQFFWMGVLSAICILYKPIFITPMALAGIGIVVTAWLNRKQPNTWKTAFLRILWMSAGLTLPLALTGAYFASLGLWERLLLVFKLGVAWINDAANMSAPDLPRPFGFPLFWMGVNNIALLLLGLLGLFRHIRRVFSRKKCRQYDLSNFISLDDLFLCAGWVERRRVSILCVTGCAVSGFHGSRRGWHLISNLEGDIHKRIGSDGVWRSGQPGCCKFCLGQFRPL